MLNLNRLRRALNADASVSDERLVEMATELIISRGLKLSRSPDARLDSDPEFCAGYEEGRRFQKEQLAARGLDVPV